LIIASSHEQKQSLVESREELQIFSTNY